MRTGKEKRGILRKEEGAHKVSEPQSSPKIPSEDSLRNAKFPVNDLMKKAITTALSRLHSQTTLKKGESSNNHSKDPGVVHWLTRLINNLASRSTAIGPP